MNRMQKFLVITAGIAVGAIGIAFILFFTMGAFQKNAEANVDQLLSAPAEGISVLSVRVSSMDIELVRASGPEVEATLRGTVWTTTEDAIPQLTFTRLGDRLEVEIERRQVIGAVSESLDLTLAIPLGFEGALEASCGSGEITGADLSLFGLTVETGSGDVDLESLIVSPGKVTATASSGRIHLDLEELASDLEIRTGSGDVTLQLPSDAGVNLFADATSGDIEVGFPITVAGTGERRDSDPVVGVVGSGEYTVRIRTGSGDITVQPR